MEQNDIRMNGGASGGEPALQDALVHVFGHRECLSLDERMRFRLPDQLAAALAQEMGRLSAGSTLSPAARLRMAFYFVPGTQGRIFLYPAQNIQVAVNRFESPPDGVDPAGLRAARDYFYGMTEFVEADRQNRLQLPAHLCRHANIGERDSRIVLVAHNLWLSISSEEAAGKLQEAGQKAFETMAAEVLDPVRRAPGGTIKDADPPHCGDNAESL